MILVKIFDHSNDWSLSAMVIDCWLNIDAMRKEFVMSMLDYCKIILQKVHFSRRLFRKEYKKSFLYLEAAEREELKRWLRGFRVRPNQFR